MKITWRNLVRMISGNWNLSDDDCDFILWERTCFPVGGRSEVIAQIKECAL